MEQTLIEHCNGASWRIVLRPTSSSGGFVRSVAAVSSKDVWAVGASLDSSTSPYHTLIEHWNGASWRVVPSPNVPSFNNVLSGVAAVSGKDVWAVGVSYPSRGEPIQTLIE